MNRNPWKVACLAGLAGLVVLLIALKITDYFFDIRLRREATGTIADVERSLRETKYQDEAIVLFRAVESDGAIQFVPAACLRMPKGRSDFAWREVSIHELRDVKHCQGAIAFVHPDKGERHTAFIYDGMVGLPTDLGVRANLTDYLAAIEAAAE